ncbi:MAG: hypothetical protein JNM16_11505 [Dechloromonas sp.]|nr:hypothetical protein [Dechloromonas sp.]
MFTFSLVLFAPCRTPIERHDNGKSDYPRKDASGLAAPAPRLLADAIGLR